MPELAAHIRAQELLEDIGLSSTDSTSLAKPSDRSLRVVKKQYLERSENGRLTESELLDIMQFLRDEENKQREEDSFGEDDTRMLKVSKYQEAANEFGVETSTVQLLHRFVHHLKLDPTKAEDVHKAPWDRKRINLKEFDFGKQEEES